MLRRRKFFDYVVLKILIYEFVDNLFELIFDGRSFEVVFKVLSILKSMVVFILMIIKSYFLRRLIRCFIFVLLRKCLFLKCFVLVLISYIFLVMVFLIVWR